MFFFPSHDTPILFQGITSISGRLQTQLALRYGTNLVAGIADKKNNTFSNLFPVFTSVKRAVHSTHPKVSVIFSTPNRALTDVLEAIHAKIPLVICTTEHVPMHDALKMQLEAQKQNVTLLGPSSAGILNVGECLTGTIPASLFTAGDIAIVGRSSSLIFEAVQQINFYGMGVSKCVSLGADHLVGTSFVPVVDNLMNDKKTKAILVIGQVHGLLEDELSEFYKKKHSKKLFVYVPGKAVVRSDKHPLLGMKSVLFSDIIKEKKKKLQKVNAIWIDSPDKIGKTIFDTLKVKKK